MPMKVVKWIVITAVAYLGLVILVETWLGVLQPTLERSKIPMLVITTTDESGASRDRRVARWESDGGLYVSAHHWPRAWYRQALENPKVRVTIDGVAGDYIAVPVEGEEYARLVAEWPIPLPMQFLMGFAPRNLLRLAPQFPR